MGSAVRALRRRRPSTTRLAVARHNNINGKIETPFPGKKKNVPPLIAHIFLDVTEGVSKVGSGGEKKNDPTKSNKKQMRCKKDGYTGLSLSTQFYVACNLVSSTMNSIAPKPLPISQKTKRKEGSSVLPILWPGYVIS